MSRGIALDIRSRATRSGNAGSCAYGEVFAIPPTRSGRNGTKDLGHSCPRQSGHLQSQRLPTSWQYLEALNFPTKAVANRERVFSYPRLVRRSRTKVTDWKVRAPADRCFYDLSAQSRYFARAESHHPQAPPLRSAACGWYPEIASEHHVTQSPPWYTTLALNRDRCIEFPSFMAHESALPNRVARPGSQLDRPVVFLIGNAL